VRRPRRETQIFSLSMMDVISGAMGAFLIIMIALMRYYKEDEDIAAQRAQLQERLAEIREQVDQAIQQLSMTTDIDVEELLRRFQQMQAQLARAQQEVNRLSNDLQAARSRVNQLQSENSRLLSRNVELQDQNRKLGNELAFRRPFLVYGTWSSPQAVDVDIYLEPVFEGQPPKAPFNPMGKSAMSFASDIHINASGNAGTEIWITRDTWPNATFKLYACIREGKYPPAPVTLRTYMAGDAEDFFIFDDVQLTPSKRWELLGFIRTDDQGNSRAAKATADEQRNDYRTVQLRVRQTETKGN